MTGTLPPVAAFEGPCCAGKTTIARMLLQQLDGVAVAFAADYADHVGGGRYLPPQEAGTVTEREQALRQLLEVEDSRLRQFSCDSDLLIADRSVHTLLAHSRAMESMTGIAFFAPSMRLLSASPTPAWPDLVFYLDLPQHAVSGRNFGKFPAGSIYINPDFNAAIRGYFAGLTRQNSPRVIWLDAMLDPAVLTRQVEATLRQLLEL